jgi:hypothetical protein
VKMMWLSTLGLTVSIALFTAGCSEVNTTSANPYKTSITVHKSENDGYII